MRVKPLNLSRHLLEQSVKVTQLSLFKGLHSTLNCIIIRLVNLPELRLQPIQLTDGRALNRL